MPVDIRMAIGTSPREIRAAVLGLAGVSLEQILARWGQRDAVPPLYSGRIRYAREPAGQERWQTAVETAARGAGDCEDLAAYRVAELHALALKGKPGGDARATIEVRVIRPELMHILVRRGDGQIEDPSRVLGMKGKG